ncbi:MAG: DUF4493 domain-containing protein [Bacteroidales bacterium]|nr:DUF4493 domain-containing protein [Bacteroidales bacterium]
MKKIYGIMMLVTLVLTACSEFKAYDQTGELSLSFNCENEYQTKGETIDINSFSVTITSLTDGSKIEYAHYSDMPQVVKLTPGDYTVSVASADVMPAAFNQPVYGGSADFTIVAGTITTATVNCTLQNVKVTIVPGETFLEEMKSFSVVVSNGEGNGHTLVWEKSDVNNGLKDGYFSVAPLTIHVDGYRSDNDAPATFDLVVSDVAAREHLILNIDAAMTGKLGGNGKKALQITVDYTTKDRYVSVKVGGFSQNPVPYEEDDYQYYPDTPVTPTSNISLVWPENPSFARYELKSEMNVTLTIKADAGIKGFLVKISSPTTSFMETLKLMATRMEGSVAVLDLLDATTAANLSFLPTGNALKNKTSVDFPLSELLPLIVAFEPAVNSVHTFTMEVTDNNGKSLSKKLEFIYKGN